MNFVFTLELTKSVDLKTWKAYRKAIYKVRLNLINVLSENKKYTYDCFFIF